MKNQALFSSKDKSKKLKCHLLQFLFGALRVYGKFTLNLCYTPVFKTKNSNSYMAARSWVSGI